MFGVRREQGRLSELAPVTRLLARHGGHWRPGLAALLVELEMEAEARAELARIDDLDGFRESLWLASLTYLTDAVRGGRRRADRRAASTPSWRPWPAQNVVIGHGVACYGAADRYLGMLATVLGDSDARASATSRRRSRSTAAWAR